MGSDGAMWVVVHGVCWDGLGLVLRRDGLRIRQGLGVFASVTTQLYMSLNIMTVYDCKLSSTISVPVYGGVSESGST